MYESSDQQTLEGDASRRWGRRALLLPHVTDPTPSAPLPSNPGSPSREAEPEPGSDSGFATPREREFQYESTQTWFELEEGSSFGTQATSNTVEVGTQTIPQPGREVGSQAVVAQGEHFVQATVQTSSGVAQTSVLCENAEVQAETDLQDAEVQTAPVGGVALWLRFYRLSRRLSFLRRTRASLTDFVRGFDGLWERAAQ